MLYLILVTGLIGLSGMTCFFPIVSRQLWRKQSSCRSSAARAQNKISPETTDSFAPRIAILLPAHNEEKVIGYSLQSFARAITRAQQIFPNSSFVIRVAADGCTDQTEAQALAHGAEVISSPACRGKWGSLERLVQASSGSDWIVFADAGVIWEEDFLAGILPIMQGEHLMGISPTYRNPAGGMLERAIWSFESQLKILECKAGGPVSTHGATVLYRTPELTNAFSRLQGQRWLNDDVVLPLVLRMLHPDREIRYLPTLGVSDHPLATSDGAVRSKLAEFRRRRRIMIGNIQWIKDLWPDVWQRNSTVGLLAMRRVFRVLWAYWGLALGIAVLMVLAGVLSFGTFIALIVSGCVTSAVMYYSLRPVQRLMEAAYASLIAPFYFYDFGFGKKVGWR